MSKLTFFKTRHLFVIQNILKCVDIYMRPAKNICCLRNRKTRPAPPYRASFVWRNQLASQLGRQMWGNIPPQLVGPAMQCNETMKCNTMKCNAIKCCAMQCYAIQCNAVQYVLQFNSIQHTALCCICSKSSTVLAAYIFRVEYKTMVGGLGG